jgi:nucleotidyltransferase substrate binding protein (TIGR01987 family)
MKTNRTGIVNQVRAIILKHANPVRIYLYGSQATGESGETSDIDIAYDDKNFKDHYIIEDEVKKINTLVKIDVVNIAGTGERFRNRVKSTGRVLYSSTKELRAHDGLYNFSNALDRFISAVDRYEEFIREGYEDIYLDLVVKRFEFTYEMSWKALKRYLEYSGLDPKSPRATFKEAYSQKLIPAEDVWLDMIEQKNLSSYIYDENEMKEILEKTEIYKKAFIELRTRLSGALDNDSMHTIT